MRDSDTGAAHCLICAQLVHLPVSSAQDPGRQTVDAEAIRPLPPPVVVHLALGEAMTMSQLDLGAEIDIALGRDRLSRHDLCFLCPAVGADVRSSLCRPPRLSRLRPEPGSESPWP